MVALLVFIMASLEIVSGRKKKLALTLSKIRLEIYSQLNSPCQLGYRGF